MNVIYIYARKVRISWRSPPPQIVLVCVWLDGGGWNRSVGP